MAYPGPPPGPPQGHASGYPQSPYPGGHGAGGPPGPRKQGPWLSVALGCGGLLIVSAAVGALGWYFVSQRAKSVMEKIEKIDLPSALPIPAPVPPNLPDVSPTGQTTAPSAPSVLAPPTATSRKPPTPAVSAAQGGAPSSGAGGASPSTSATPPSASTAAPSVSAACARAVACCKNLLAKAPGAASNCDALSTSQNDQVCQQQLETFRAAGKLFGVTCP